MESEKIVIKWHPVEEEGPPQKNGNYLVTVKLKSLSAIRDEPGSPHYAVKKAAYNVKDGKWRNEYLNEIYFVHAWTKLDPYI